MYCALSGAFIVRAKRSKVMKRKASTLFLLIALIIPQAATVQAHSEDLPPVKYGIALDIGGTGDNSYNDAVMAAVTSFKKRYQIPDSYIRSVTTDGTYLDRLARLRLFAKSGYRMIIAVGSEYDRALTKVAGENPDLTFAVINSEGVAALNVSCLPFNERQAAFLAGIAAGATSRTGVVGFIGTAATIDAYPYFTQGVIFAQSKATTQPLIYDGTTSAIKEFLNSKVDVLYSTWSLDSSILNAVKSATSKTKKIWLITETPDQYFSLLPTEKKYILATINKRVDKAVTDVLELGRNRQSVLDIVSEVNGTYGRMYSVTNAGLSLKFLNPVTSATSSAIARGIVAIKQGKLSTQG